MAIKDFRAKRIETSRLIASGAIPVDGKTVGLVIYSGSIATDREGTTANPNLSTMLGGVGTDVFMFVSGTINTDNSSFSRSNVALFGGDIVVSGTLYAERQVIEVDSVADGDFFVTGNMYLEPDANSTEAVAFRQADGTNVFVLNTSSPTLHLTGNLYSEASSDSTKSVSFRNAAGTDIFTVDSTNQRVGIGDNTPGGTLEIQGGSSSGVPTLMIDHRDTANLAVSINALNVNADVIDITADAVTTAKVIDITADGLTTGNAIFVDDNSSNTSERRTVEIIQQHTSAKGATALVVTSSGGRTGIKLDKDYSQTAASTVMGVEIELDKTGATTTDNLIFGVHVLAANTSATNGVNEMTGIYSNARLEHANNAGVANVVGVSAYAVGHANGSSQVIGLSGSAVGGDVNIGLQLSADDPGPSIKVLNPSDPDDYFTLHTTANGATTITTVDSNAQAANLNFSIDGAADIQSYGAITIDSSNSTIGIGTDSNNQSINVGTGGDRSISVGKSGGTSTVAVYSKGGTLLLDGTGQTVDINSTAFDVDAAGAATIDAVGTSNFTTNGALTISGSTGLNLASHGGEIDLTTRIDKIDINAGTSIELTAATDVQLAAAADVLIDVDGEIILDSRKSTTYKDGGVSYLKISKDVSGNAVLSSSVHNKDIVLFGDKAKEVLRVKSQNNSVLILSGGSDKSPDETDYTDMNFFVSGTIGSRGTLVRGAALFGGDLAVSGTISKIDISGKAPIILDDPGIVLSPGTFIEFGDPGENIFGDGSHLYISSSDDLFLVALDKLKLDAIGGKVEFHKETVEFFRIANDSNDVLFQPQQSNKDLIIKTQGGAEAFRVDSSNKMVLILSGGNSGTTPSETDYTDTNFFVSGTIGSKGSGVRGTSVFGGDLHLSGALNVDGGASIEGGVRFNESSNSVDFRVETNNYANALIVKGSTDRVGIGKVSAPQTTLHIKDATPSTRLQRDDNANPITLQFVGSGGTVANSIQQPGDNSNDFVFNTWNGSAAEESFRVNSNRQVIVLSGTTMHAGAIHPVKCADVNFFVSGTIGSRGTLARGASLFGGDLAVSGSISKIDFNGKRPIVLDDPGVILSAGTVVEFGDPGENIFGDGTNLLIASSEKVLILSGGNSGTTPNEKDYPDINFFVSGSALSKGSGTRGTALFGGDLHTSGNLSLETKKRVSFGFDTKESIEGDGENLLLSTKKRFLFNSGSESAATDNDEGVYTDMNFFVSGAIGSRSTAIRGTALFGGDLVVSGAVFIQTGSVSQGLILTSPNGSRFRINVGNDGTLFTSEG